MSWLLPTNGYEMVTAANGHEGLRLFMTKPVDAIVLEYHLGLMDGAVIASEIKHVCPQVPIVMLIDNLELPEDALQSVDAIVAKSDGPQFLLATIRFVLNVKRLRAVTRSHDSSLPRRALAPAKCRGATFRTACRTV
jgi:DNA-binding response OmpR family regulator